MKALWDVAKIIFTGKFIHLSGFIGRNKDSYDVLCKLRPNFKIYSVNI